MQAVVHAVKCYSALPRQSSHNRDSRLLQILLFPNDDELVIQLLGFVFLFVVREMKNAQNAGLMQEIEKGGHAQNAGLMQEIEKGGMET